MSDQKNSTQDQTKTPVAANQHGGDKKVEGQAQTTGAQPGMPQRNEQGKPSGSTDGRNTKQEPNPGPGVTSQGHRVDEDTPANGNEQDADRKQPTSSKDMPSSDKPRDQDKDRKEPMAEHKSGDKKPEEAHQNKH